MKRFKRESGFTLVELLLATALFSFILLFAVNGFVYINQAYSKGQTIKQMHQSARQIMDLISRSMIDASSSDNLVIQSIPPDTANRFCVPNHIEFRWVEGYVDRSNSLLYSIAYTPADSSCNSIGTTIPNFGGPINLTNERVAVKNIDINPKYGGAYEIVVELATNRADVFSNPDLCQPTDPYCDFVTLRTVVTLRN